MKKNIKEIVSQLTLEEKASLCSGKDSWKTEDIPRLGIPQLWLSDGPHGLRKPEAKPEGGYGPAVPATCFPTASALACSWDRELVNTVSSAIAEEAKGEGVGILLGPGINMKRSPLCGRNFEYYSEDPYLAGELGCSYVKGVQSKNVGVSLKHFAVNNQETRRFTVSANVDERTLREIYLPAFENVVKNAEPATVMESYNCVNGKNVSDSKWLLEGILREEWGFKGFVMSDWNAVHDRVVSLDAGLELEMPTSYGVRDEQIVEAVKSGELDEKVLDRAVERILNIVFKYAEQKAEKADLEAHHLLAGKAEAECIVLLKNEGEILPFKKGASLAVIGEFAEKPRFQGGGSSNINYFKTGNVLDEINAQNGEYVYAKGYSLAGEGDSEALIAEAVAAAKAAGRAVIFAGLPPASETEGRDRVHMRMPEEHNKLIEAVCAEVKNVAVVLVAGSPVEMPWKDTAPAIIHTYLGGQNVAYGVAAVLFGDVNPSGHLAETLPLALEDTPCYLNFPGDRDVCNYGEGIYIGYRWYEKMKKAVAFPFGHGLSYTEFELSDAMLEDNTVTVTVKNTGKCFGKTVVQLYVGQQDPMISRPVKELKGFEKVALEAGEEKKITLKLDERSYAFYDVVTKAWRATTGKYTISLGFSSADIRAELVTEITEKDPPKAEIRRNTVVRDLASDEAYSYCAEEILDKVFGGKLNEEIVEYGLSTTAPAIKRFGYYGIRMFVPRKTINEKQLSAIIEEANKKREL